MGFLPNCAFLVPSSIYGADQTIMTGCTCIYGPPIFFPFGHSLVTFDLCPLVNCLSRVTPASPLNQLSSLRLASSPFFIFLLQKPSPFHQTLTHFITPSFFLMAKTKGLQGSGSHSRTTKLSSKSKSKGFKHKHQANQSRRRSLRNPNPSVPVAAAGSSSPLTVSSDSDRSNPSSPHPAAPSIPVSVSPPPSPSAFESSERFLKGRTSLFDSCFSRRPVTLERSVEFSHFTEEFSFIRTIFETRGWLCIGDLRGTASIELVREFYTNFHNISPDQGCFDTLVRGRVLHISADFLSSFLRVGRTPNPTFPNVVWATYPPLHELVVPMRDNPYPWFPGMLFRQSDLSVPFRVLNLICDSLLTPTNRSSEISEDKIKFLFGLTHELSIDLPSLVLQSMISAHNQKNSRLALPYGVLITNLLRDHFAIAKDLDEAVLVQDAPINRHTIRRTMAQKQPIHSETPPSSEPLHSTLRSRTASQSNSDPLSVVVFTLQSFSERLTRLESSNTVLLDTLQSRLQTITDNVQVQFDTLHMHTLELLQAAANSASSVATRMDGVESSVRGLIDPAQRSLEDISNQLNHLANDVGDLNRTFRRIEDFCRRGSRSAPR